MNSHVWIDAASAEILAQVHSYFATFGDFISSILQLYIIYLYGKLGVDDLNKKEIENNDEGLEF